MGKKGDKQTQQSTLVMEVLLERLSPIDGITAKRMFGGHGIFHDLKMIGMVDSKGRVFLKSDEISQPHFEALGTEKHSKMPYYRLPENLLEDVDQLLSWAQRSIEVKNRLLKD